MSEYAPYRPYVPEDMESFWLETASEAKSARLDYRRSMSNDFDLPGFRVERIEFLGMHEAQLHGWIAAPEGARKAPGFLWVPPYGRESLLPNEYGTREGLVSMSFNFFGHDAFHQETYRMERGYFSEGIEDPESFIFRTMFQNAYIAARVFQAQIEVDEDRIGVAGMSQGAGISIWLGAWCSIIKAVCADMPFFGAMNDTLRKQVYRYPLKEITDHADTIPLGIERVLHTVSYFDTLNQATFCKVPTHVSLGEKDPSCRPPVVESIYKALPGSKELHRYEIGHDWFPDMVPNNRNWLLANL